MTISVAVFTSDLRLHDNPVLRAALQYAEETVPLFVHDEAIRAGGFAAPNRAAFLAECLADLDAGLRERGGRLVQRRGEFVREVRRVAAEADADEVHIAGGVSGYAMRREERLRAALEADGRRVHAHSGSITVVPPGALLPSGSDHFAVFTPYYRQWRQHPVRRPLRAPAAVAVPDRLDSHEPPAPGGAATSPGRMPGGERAGRAAFERWSRRGLSDYERLHDALADDATSRLSPYLHFGALSPAEVVQRARQTPGAGAEAFVRQMCWRDFHHQVLAARPDSSLADYRARGDRWRGESEAAGEIEAWRAGLTGYPIVDAAMRQLRHEGWMHNRARMIAASFLVKTLYVDWRIGARHFLELLVDGDVANNQLNWQWVAGTGTDTRPDRILNPLRQAARYDPGADYVRRWVPELAGLEPPAAHEPWRLVGLERAQVDYPEPLVDLRSAPSRFRRAHAAG